ncbi:MAG: hypothetical protein SVW02_02330 [Candidatus Nanohaloarchaea archaeon]|nr:hypothetical protein [Candidatus Nanohaloarchaea archaeon]
MQPLQHPFPVLDLLLDLVGVEPELLLYTVEYGAVRLLGERVVH